MKNKVKIANLFLFISIVATACIGLDLAPYEGQTDLTYWDKTSSAEEAANACYNYMGNHQEVFYNDAMSDNAYASKPAGYTQSIANGKVETTDGYVAGIWSGRYAGIRLCNKLLENIHRVPELTDELRNRYTGEAKILRAINYYELLIRFGDIPYFTNTLSIAESTNIGRTPKNTVIGNIIADIDEVLNNNMLPGSYDAKDVGRITKWGAMGVKARVYLSQNMWPELEFVTSEIIAKSGCELFPSFTGLFDVDNENNKEVLIDIQYAPKIREYSNASDFLPPSMKGHCQLAPLQSLVDNYIMLNGESADRTNNSYENRDPRLAATVIYNGNGYSQGSPINTKEGMDKAFGPDGTSPTGFYFKKYYDKYSTPGVVGSGLNIIYLRYGDILLMHAEALAEQGKLTETEWNKTIRPLRYRAGFREESALGYPTTGTNLVNVIRTERRSELAFEGLRYTDIIRWRIAETVLNGNALGAYTGESGTIVENGHRIVEKRKFDKGKHYLWPIPQAERFLNKNLGQNPNW